MRLKAFVTILLSLALHAYGEEKDIYNTSLYGTHDSKNKCTEEAGCTNQNHTKNTIAVFCSSNDKVSDILKKAAYDLGQKLFNHKVAITTCGYKKGLMKEVVDGYCSSTPDNCTVYGIVPKALKPYNLEHPLIPKGNIIWTESINSRLEEFEKTSDIIIVLPGGLGTLNELIKFSLHKNLQLMNKRIILLNHEGFWNPLLQQFQNMLQIGTLSKQTSTLIEVTTSVEGVMELIEAK